MIIYTATTATTTPVYYRAVPIDPRVTVMREFGDLGDSNQQFAARARMLFQCLPSWRDDPTYNLRRRHRIRTRPFVDGDEADRGSDRSERR